MTDLVQTGLQSVAPSRPTTAALMRGLRGTGPDVHAPAISTVHAVLDRHGLVKRRMGRRNRARGTPLSLAGQPNELWCADYKGEFMLADRRYCYPLTITDFASRYLFACEALSTTKEAYAFPVFEAVFKQFGLPKAIRTDNGVPFASPNTFDTEEIDVALWNDKHVFGFPFLPDIILVECKNWSAAVGSGEVNWFDTKLRNRGLEFGVLVATNGITGNGSDLTAAHKIVADALKEKRRLVVITTAEIQRLMDTNELVLLLKEKICQLAVMGSLA